MAPPETPEEAMDLIPAPVLDELAARRAALVARARVLAPKLDTKGRGEVDIMRSALREAGQTVPETASDDYVRGLFAAAGTPSTWSDDDRTALAGKADGKGADTVEDARKAARAERAKQYKARTGAAAGAR